jgi:hypothetical protein
MPAQQHFIIEMGFLVIFFVRNAGESLLKKTGKSKKFLFPGFTNK